MVIYHGSIFCFYLRVLSWRLYTMGGWVIRDLIISSRRFNRLYNHPLGVYAQNVYLISYTLSDAWGHLPFDYEWLSLKVIPGNKKITTDDIKTIMVLLCVVGLWDPPYVVDDNLYVHIFNFEKINFEGIRRRRKALWEAENGVIPHRNEKEPFQENLNFWNDIRKTSSNNVNLWDLEEYSTIFRNITECSGIFRQYSIGIGIGIGTRKKTEKTADAGPLKKKISGNLTLGKTVISENYMNKLLKTIGYDYYQFYLILYRAKDADDPIAYIEQGIKSGYIYKACIDEEKDPLKVKSWIDDKMGIISTDSVANTGIQSIKSILSTLKKENDHA